MIRPGEDPYNGSKLGSGYKIGVNSRNHDDIGMRPPLPKPRFNWNSRNGDKKRKQRRPPNRGFPEDIRMAYEPPRLHFLPAQNRLKARRVFHPKKFRAPFAPRNTTSFIIRAKKSGGIASLVSPYPVTPAVLPTPVLSPAREGLIDMAKEEWGVNGYGSMKGLIRLRAEGRNTRGQDDDDDEEEEEDDDDSESDSDVDQAHYSLRSVEQFERRLDQDLSRFEMIYPSGSSVNYSNYTYNDGANLLGTRVDDQDSHILHLEEENLILKERLFLMEQELDDLRRRLLRLEGGRNASDDEAEVCSEKSVGDASCACD